MTPLDTLDKMRRKIFKIYAVILPLGLCFFYFPAIALGLADRIGRDQVSLPYNIFLASMVLIELGSLVCAYGLFRQTGWARKLTIGLNQVLMLQSIYVDIMLVHGVNVSLFTIPCALVIIHFLLVPGSQSLSDRPVPN